MRVEPDPDRLAAAGVLVTALAGAQETRIEAGPLFASREDDARTVVGMRSGRPIYRAAEPGGEGAVL